MSSTLLTRKIKHWEHQLLDLGKRNRMINYRDTKRSTLRLVEPSFEELFQRIAINEETLTFQRAVDRETDIRVFSILSLLEHLSSPLPVTIGDIKAEGSILDRQKALKNIRSKARLSLEEQGTNILYLSFGFIEWRDGKGASAQWIKSPLILVPTVLTLEALNSPYTLSKHEDDIVVNPTLQYYLKTEYGIELPGFDSDKDTLEGYLVSLEEIANQRGWRILKEVSLGLLSFLKISMYNDLIRNEKRIKSNPVIRAMAGDSEEVNAIPEELRTFDLDSIGTQDCYQVMSADSSQQDAILYSKNNISFVMQGPPGTGKSQTITNIIAEALADGKKVLFVSEKMAALQVVYRRLQEARLADFCLPLHSYKANKKDILEQIGANLKLKQTQVKTEALLELNELMSIRQELNQYADELHHVNHELNMSCYEVFSKLEAVYDAPSLTFEINPLLDVSQAQLQMYLNKINEYALSLQRLEYRIYDNPWEGLQTRASGYEYSKQMQEELTTLNDGLTAILDCITQIGECPNLQSALTYALLPSLVDSINLIHSLPAVPDGWLDQDKVPSLITEAKKANRRYERLFTLENEVAGVFSAGIYDYDYNEWKTKLLFDANGIVEMPYIQSHSASYFVDNAQSLRQVFSNVRTGLLQAKAEFAAISDLLGIELSVNTAHLHCLTQLLALIKKNDIIIPKWFTEDVAKIRIIAQEAKEKAAHLFEIRNQILTDWEADILALDYSPILLRYKTEYTSFFRFFNSQYRKDKRQLQALSKTIIKKLPDDMASSLLLKLKDYHEQETWFENKKAELSEVLSTYYAGPQTKWDDVLTALLTIEKLKQLPEAYLSSSLIDIVSRDHTEATTLLQNHIAAATASFGQVYEALKSSPVVINVTSPDFNGVEAITIVEEYLRCLQLVEDQFAKLTPYLHDAHAPVESICYGIEKLNDHKKLSEFLNVNAEKFKVLFDFHFSDRQTNWVNIILLLKRILDIDELGLFDELKTLVNTNSLRKNEIQKLASHITDLYTSVQSSFAWLSTQFAPSIFCDTIDLNTLAEKTTGCLTAMPMLGNWIDYQEAKEDCCKNGLTDFIDKIESTQLPADIEKIFLKGFYRMWLGTVCKKLASVGKFKRNTHDKRIERFIELDDRQLSIAQMRIREKLIETLPSDHQLLKATDEVAILKKELSKKRNIMPLRKLFKLIPNLLMKLKPCLMMSPLSVSYFLETEAYHFDLVIFDEASQIFPEDAIGAIFRGAQVIIAGDSKQLPPTNFFSASTNSGDGDYDISGEEDYNEIVSDSILEESASVLPNRTLLWHYRSKHEGLIAFSNREIYGNNLITFPNSITQVPDMGVEYIYVENGFYEGGGKNCNIREAQKCVMLVLKHIQSHPDRSLGIIAFSEKQQAAIENAIIDFRERNPKYEKFFDEAKDEPFFVKNLENVQGDERDTIIFSICYAKDRNGKMYMRFGPLGHEGGERRLNVAITRAKCNIKLVGSILPSDIDLSRTNSQGVRMLRSYIEFARKGTTALKPIEKKDVFESEDEFCKIIVSFLKAHGYSVETQVGCSDYKIDIAIKNPNAEGEYIAGIECDGFSYIQARTARDRDHLRRTILQNMGWNLYRVWSAEWMRNPIAEGDALLNFLQSVTDEDGNVTHAVKHSNEEISSVSIEQIAIETEKTDQNRSADNPYGFTYYKEANCWDAPLTSAYDSQSRISDRICYVVSVEQPMHMDLLYKRMGPSFTAGKATEAVKNTIDEVIAKKLKSKVKIDKDDFIRLIPETPIVVRVPKHYDTLRPMEYIHTEEVARAMLTIIQCSFGITVEDLATECVRAFGFERKGQRIKQKTDAAIDYLITKKLIKVIDNKVQLTNNRQV